MLIKNAKVFVGKSFVDADILFDEKILAIGSLEGEADLDAEGAYVIPGLVDVHTHGCVGGDTMDAEFAEMCDYLAKNGVTSWLPTTMTVSMEDISKTMNSATDCKNLLFPFLA